MTSDRITLVLDILDSYVLGGPRNMPAPF
jgi:hypothetical protein